MFGRMSVPYSRPEYGYDSRNDSRDYDSRRRTYRPARARGGPPAKQPVRLYYSYYICFLYSMHSNLKCAERDLIGEDIVVAVN